MTNKTLIPIYCTDGEIKAYLAYPYLFNAYGEWIGFVTSKREVYSVYGNYVGWLNNEPRILRKRSYDFQKPRISPPPSPKKIRVPSRHPLVPMLAELGFDTVDVLQDAADLLPTIDVGEFKVDLE